EEDGRHTVDLQEPELDAVDLREAQLLDLAMESVRYPLADEDQPRRTLVRDAAARVEPLERLRILAGPRVRLHRLEEHLLVGGEARGDQHERAIGVEPHDVDRRVSEQQARIEDHEPRLDGVDVLCHQRLQLRLVLDPQLLDGHFHRARSPSLSRYAALDAAAITQSKYQR